MSTSSVYEYVVYLNDPKEKSRKALTGIVSITAPSADVARALAYRSEAVLAVADDDLGNVEVEVRPFSCR